MQMNESRGKKVYRFLISLRFSIVLLVLLTVDLSAGYLFLFGNASFYEPMNEVGLRQWLMTYGVSDPLLLSWFFVLLILLFCLVVNTLLCTCDKLYHLFTSSRKNYRGRGFRLTLFIHLMHVAMVLLLAGYLISYTSGTIYNKITLRSGGSYEVYNTGITIELAGMEMVPYTGGRSESFKDRYLDAQAFLRLSARDETVEKVMSLNNPVFYGGYSFFLQRFNPMYQGGMSAVEYIVLDVRRDPGVRFTFAGMAVFVFGFCGYLWLQNRPAKIRRDQG